MGYVSFREGMLNIGEFYMHGGFSKFDVIDQCHNKYPEKSMKHIIMGLCSCNFC